MDGALAPLARSVVPAKRTPWSLAALRAQHWLPCIERPKSAKRLLTFALCSVPLSCNRKGRCTNGRCVCLKPYYGEACQYRKIDERLDRSKEPLNADPNV